MAKKKRLARALAATLSVAMVGANLGTPGMLVHAQQGLYQDVDGYENFTSDKVVADFNFGSDITANSGYDRNRGYGFSDINYDVTPWGWKNNIYYCRAEYRVESAHSYVGAVNGGKGLAIRSKVWTETESTGYGVFTYEDTSTFDMAVYNADYNVDVTFSNPTGSAYTAYVEAENITKKTDISVPAWGTKTVSFQANVVDGMLNLKFLAPNNATSINTVEKTVYVERVKVTRKATEKRGSKPTIFIASDSTVQTYDSYYYPQTGWGQVLASYFGSSVSESSCTNCGYGQSRRYETDKVIIENRAIGGRSSKSFIDEGKFDDMIEDVKPGDYVMVQWGHNDATYSRPNRYVQAKDFEYFIMYYVNAALQRGATPILVTPVARYSYTTNSDGSLKSFASNFDAYRQVMLKIAQEKNIPLIDLTQRSIDECNKAGISGAKGYFLHVDKGQYPNGAYKNGATDSTHLQYNGAMKFAGCVAQGILEYSASSALDGLKRLVNGANIDSGSDNGSGNDNQPKDTYLFDINCNNSPTQAGWVGVNQNQSYSKALGYGWLVTPDNGRDRATNVTDTPNMARDFSIGLGEFAADIPNGTYEVTIYGGDTMANTRTSVSYLVEGQDFGGIESSQTLEKITKEVTISDGQINIKVQGKNPYISGIKISKLQKLTAPSGLVATEASFNGNKYSFLLSINVDSIAEGYRIYQKSANESQFRMVKTFTTEQYYADELACRSMSVDAGTTYEFYATAYKDGVETAPSETIKVDATNGSNQGGNNQNDNNQGETIPPVIVNSGDGREHYSDRALVAINLAGNTGAETLISATDKNGNKISRGVYLSWRSFKAEIGNDNILRTSFDVYRNGQAIAKNIKVTNLVDEGGSANDTYKVVGSNDSALGVTAKDTKCWSNQYLDLTLYCPAGQRMPDNTRCDYTANDMTVADLDGDGVLELVVKWVPSNQKDNSQAGYTGTTFIDGYDVDYATGAVKLLWRIDLGINVRSGAHYTQFQVWDYNCDGKAEIAIKTADGTTTHRSKDGTAAGLYENGHVGVCSTAVLPSHRISAQYDYRNTSGYVLAGPEYFTMFNGADGSIIDSVSYTPQRGNVADWGDKYGNRVDRFLSATAYVNGSTPSAIFARGYYTRAVVVAYSLKSAGGGKYKIVTDWVFDSNTAGKQYEAQGNHGISVNDVDGDGKDEIIYGAFCIDHNGVAKYNTGLGHGDAMHVSDWVPSNPGLEVFRVGEHTGVQYQVEVHDANTGKVLMGYKTGKDTGRGVAADIDPTALGAEFWASYGVNGTSQVYSTLSTLNNVIALSNKTVPSINFTLFWDGDLLSELQDHNFDSAAYAPRGVNIQKWNNESESSDTLLYSTQIHSSNGSKGNLGLVGDILGDWREEIIARSSSDNNVVRIYTTTIQTDYVVPCLLEDLAYREGIAWQNVAYNQPANLSYLLSEGVETARLKVEKTTATTAKINFTAASDGKYGHAVDGYQIYRSKNGGSYELIDTVMNDQLKLAASQSFSDRLGQTRKTVYEYVDRNLEKSTKYSYKVAAYVNGRSSYMSKAIETVTNNVLSEEDYEIPATQEPTKEPTKEPTLEPTVAPTKEPTKEQPTVAPTKAPQTSSKAVVLKDIDFDKEINLSSYDYKNIKKISVKFGGSASQFNGAVVIGSWVAQESYSQSECPDKTFTFDFKNQESTITIKTWWSDTTFTLERVTLIYGEEESSTEVAPTQEPTKEPTKEPTQAPTQEPTQEPTKEPQNNYALADGWYYIKNVHAQKYLTVAGNTGNAGQNVELRTGSGIDGQKWYVKNLDNGYVTLKTALGDFMIDVAYGSADDETNIGIFNGYSGDAQQFKLKPASSSNEFYIATKVSNDNSVLDDYQNSKSDGANVIQWRYNGNANQRFVFERIGGEESQPETPTQTPTSEPVGQITNKPLSAIKKGNQATNVSVHDPSIVESNGMFYFFGSHMAAAKSSNLKNFTMFADGVNANNRLFSNLFTGNMGAFSYTGKNVDGGYAVWAPDVIWNKDMRKWTMYFCTSHDWRTSALCMAVADNIEGPYTYTNTLLCSGFNASTVQKTNFYEVMGNNANVNAYLSNGQYDYKRYPNCIDPTVFYDKDGKLWMTYGSWSGGIFLLELDRYTGLPIHPQTDTSRQVDKYFGYHLIGGNHKSCEGPYIMYDNTTEYYYLFVSYGELTRTGGYQIRQFRSKNVTGPYTDINGQTLGSVNDHRGYGIKMMGNYSLPSLTTSYMAPGHNSVMKASDGKYYLAYHQRMDNSTEYHEVRVHQMFLNEDGWFVAAPFSYADEKLASSWTKKPYEWCGQFYGVNHGTDISATIHPYKEWIFETNNTFRTPDGTWGTYEIKNSYITMKAGNDTYRGVIGQMKDEAGNEVVFISAVNNRNETVWVVKYL